MAAVDKLIVTSIRPDVNSIRTHGTFQLVAEALDRLDGNLSRTAGFVNNIKPSSTTIIEGPGEPPPPAEQTGQISYDP
jgi:hypothetical protein